MHFQYPTTFNNIGLFQGIANTPQKRVKPNEDSTFDHSKMKAPKLSILQKLNDRSMDWQRKEEHVKPRFQISQFDLPVEYKSSDKSEKMEEENDDYGMHNMGLGRKMTYMEKDSCEDAINTLNLYRSNSTFDQGRIVQEFKLGDNIYLRQINSQQAIPTSRQMTNQNEHGLRIQQDYEIEKNLAVHKKRHENYICLNKLQRIFYYVKKVILSFQGKQNYEQIQQLTSQQVKIYHKDTQGSFLRFYQSWFEHNALYLTYEVAAQSLYDCTLASKRLREVEAWDLLRDCSRSLAWLNSKFNTSHLNIKPGNILKCQKKFKLADPLLQPTILQSYLKLQNADWDGYAYLAPEIKRFYSLIEGLDLRQADIFSLGMCLIENLLGERYFPREGKQMRMFIRQHIHGYSPSLIKTLLRMVSSDPTKRPSAEELCEIGKGIDSSKSIKRRRFSV